MRRQTLGAVSGNKHGAAPTNTSINTAPHSARDVHTIIALYGNIRYTASAAGRMDVEWNVVSSMTKSTAHVKHLLSPERDEREQRQYRKRMEHQLFTNYRKT